MQKKMRCGKEKVEQRGRKWQDAGGNYIMRSVIICTYCQIIVWRPNDGQWDGTRMWHTRKRIKKTLRHGWENLQEWDKVVNLLLEIPVSSLMFWKPNSYFMRVCLYTFSPHCCVLRASDKPQLQVKLCNACQIMFRVHAVQRRWRSCRYCWRL
jgi:hypothetical protein